MCIRDRCYCTLSYTDFIERKRELLPQIPSTRNYSLLLFSILLKHSLFLFQYFTQIKLNEIVVEHTVFAFANDLVIVAH